MQRKLTVIVSADVVGYSRLMERDEAGTFARLKANRKEIFDPRVAAHGGRVVKLMGDGALVEFASVVAAVNCARRDPAGERRPTPARTDAERICYRIGHQPRRCHRRGRRHLRRRRERRRAAAGAGRARQHRAVADRARPGRGQGAAEFDDLGEHTVKNIARPMHVLRAAARRSAGCRHASAPPARAARAAPVDLRAAVRQHERRSGAGILQRRHHRGHHHRSFQGVGAVGRLAQHARSRSRASTSDVAQVARQLKVTHVLEGSVRKAGNRVRITAQLIEGATDSHLWAERYDRDLDDIFALQDEISEAIVGALKLQAAARREEGDRAAVDDESRGVQALPDGAPVQRDGQLAPSRHHGPAVCERAVEIDPDYARAWALLAICQANTPDWSTPAPATPAGQQRSARLRSSPISPKRMRRRAAFWAMPAATTKRCSSTRRAAARSGRLRGECGGGALLHRACAATRRPSCASRRRPRRSKPISGRWAWRSSATKRWATSKARDPRRDADSSASRR